MDHWWLVCGTHLGPTDLVTTSTCGLSFRKITRSLQMHVTTGFSGNWCFAGLIHFGKGQAQLGSDLSFELWFVCVATWYLKEEKAEPSAKVSSLVRIVDASHALPADLLLQHWLHSWSSHLQNQCSGMVGVDWSRNFVLGSGPTLTPFGDLFNACINVSM